MQTRCPGAGEALGWWHCTPHPWVPLWHGPRVLGRPCLSPPRRRPRGRAAMCPANPPRGAETYVGPLAQGARLAACPRPRPLSSEGDTPLLPRHRVACQPSPSQKARFLPKKLHLPATRSIHTLLYRVCGSGLCVDERRTSAVAHAAMPSEPCSRPPVSASLDEHAGTTCCLFPPATRCPRKPETHRLCFYNKDYKRIKFAKHRIKNSSSFEHLI